VGPRIMDPLRRLYRQPPKAELSPESLDEVEAHASAISDPGAEQINVAWELEWERCLLAEAMARVKRTANPKHFQVFDYCVLKEWPVTKVASTLGVSAAQVYLAKHRVSQLVKQTARTVRAEWSAEGGTS